MDKIFFNDIMPLVAKSKCMNEAIKYIKSLKSARTFSLIGNYACGKKFLANHFITLWSKTKYFIDCTNKTIDFKTLEDLSTNMENQTFIINHPEKLDTSQQLKLFNIINATIGTNAKQWIHIIDVKEEINIHKGLYERTSLFRVMIPDLKDRKEDIPYIVKIIQKNIAKALNKKLYKIDMQYILNNVWQNNFIELKQYIEQMFFITHNEFEEEPIILDEVFFSMNLKDATKLFQSVYLTRHISNKTYKMAAYNANINRTTLYRKLRKQVNSNALKNDEHKQMAKEEKTERENMA